MALGTLREELSISTEGDPLFRRFFYYSQTGNDFAFEVRHWVGGGVMLGPLAALHATAVFCALCFS